MIRSERKKIQSWLRRLLTSGELTGQELARDLGVCNSTVSRFKTGARTITSDWIVEHSSKLLSTALATGDDYVRDLLYDSADMDAERHVSEQQRKGNVILPTTRRRTLLAAKRRSRIR